MTIRDLFSLAATAIVYTLAATAVLTIIGPYPTLGLVSCAAAYQIFRAYAEAKARRS